MKCKCIKADPLGWLKVGDTYDIYKKENVYIIEGYGFAVSHQSFEEMFIKGGQ